MTVLISYVGRESFRIYHIHRIIEKKDELHLIGYTHTETPTVIPRAEMRVPLQVAFD